jgi:dihydrolipoamide dehydrogenase
LRKGEVTVQTLRYDAVVIGSGPGGYVAGIRLGQLFAGKKKALVIEREKAGGVCLNVGCIPSKAVITAAKTYERMRTAETMGITAQNVKADMAKLRDWKDGIVTKLTGGVKLLLKTNGTELRAGEARFVDAHTLEVTGGPEPVRIEFGDCIIATGSRPIEIPGFKFDEQRILSSTGGLALGEVPAELVVIGGGYIGLELGTALAKLGSKVTVVEATGSLLPGTDPELTQVVARRLKKHGVEVHLEAKAKGFVEKQGRLTVMVEAAGGKELQLPADKVLVTVGRRPNSENLGLDKAGVKTDARGFITVDHQQRTSAANIYAIGDVVGGFMLAHKASREADVAAEVIAGKNAAMDVRAIPAVIFTDPEIASVGQTESQAEKAGHKVKVGKFPYAALGRAMTMMETDGFVKVVADADSGEVLGVHLVGPDASDQISEAALAVEMGALADDLALTIHPHPTLPEAIMEAAMGVFGQPVHVAKR